MSQEYALLEIRVRKKEIRGEGEDSKKEYYPVEMTLEPPDDAKKDFPTGYLSSEVFEWKHRGDSQEDGKRLFDLFFTDSQLRQNWTKSQGLSKGKFRIRLRFDDDETIAPLHAIPWEVLCDTTVDPPKKLADDRNTPFSRYVTGKASGKTIAERPIKILVAVASPKKLKLEGELLAVDVVLEEQIIIDALADLASGQVELTFLDQPVTLPKLETALKQDHYHILHIVAHGRFVENLGAAYLYLADDNHKAKPVTDQDFAAMIKRQGEYVPQFIFLASCQMAKRPKDDSFQGFAPGLTQAGVPAVLAMQEKIHIPTSQAFTRTFYSELFQHGQVDLACNAARSKVLTEELLGSHIPVLFSRLHNNQLLVPQAGSKRKDFEPETVHIRSGKFSMGSDPGENVSTWESPQHEVNLPAYRIGKYPITNEQYVEFIRRTKHPVHPEMGWQGLKPPCNKLRHPVAGVTWYDALAYCEWLKEQTGQDYTLPSEAQWEKAARGPDGLIYPWGNEWDPNSCNHGSDQTAPVDAHPQGVSPYGCYDMVGNVREWTSTLWGERMTSPDPKFRYHWADDGRDDLAARDHIYRVYRGGAASDDELQLRCSARNGFDPRQTGLSNKRHGFRVVIKL